jgi:hypothetical protein
MSIEPCQICNGTGFIQVPISATELPPAGVLQNPPHDPKQAGVQPQPTEEVPCPTCSGSGVSGGL